MPLFGHTPEHFLREVSSLNMFIELFFCHGRNERIRTSGLLDPNQALYQAKLHSVVARRGLRPAGRAKSSLAAP